MPTPLEILLDPISLAALALYAALMLVELLAPGRKLPKVRGWLARCLVSFAAYFYLSSYLPLLWDSHLSQLRLVDLTNLHPVLAGFAAVFVYEFALYGWHRWMHHSDALWRVFHQMHHSAERLDTYGAFYFSPMDMAGFTLLGSLALALVGIGPEASTVFLFATLFLGIFQHMNVRTPRWLGYIIQRPESHTVHHARGVHRYNYSDLPIFDILFGTFRNPKGYEHETGFYHGASARVREMLSWRDVSTEAEPSISVSNEGSRSTP